MSKKRNISLSLITAGVIYDLNDNYRNLFYKGKSKPGTNILKTDFDGDSVVKSKTLNKYNKNLKLEKY